MVSVIILSYNTMQILEECLRSVFEALNGLSFEVIVVDNNSSDQSVAMVKKKFPKARLIENKENVGFARGVNQGAQVAKGAYLFLLNSDALMHDKSFHDMLEFLRKNDQIGIVGGTLDNADGSTSKSYGSFYSLSKVFHMLFFDKSDKSGKFHQPTQVDWVSGGYMLMRRDSFVTLNGFDEHFFMYMEDMELCYRARKNNIQVWYFPKASVTHSGQGSSNRTFAVVQIFKGLQYFYKKHKSFVEYVFVKLMLITKSLMSMILGLVTRNMYLTTTYKKAFLTTL